MSFIVQFKNGGLTMSLLYIKLFLVAISLLKTKADYINTLWSRYKHLSHIVNVNFSDDILWREQEEGVNNCGRRCHHDSSCQSFVYNTNSKTCQSHRSCFLTENSNNFTTTPASKYYVLNDGQCSRRFSEKKIIWKSCKPTSELQGSVGNPVYGRRVIVEGILGTLGRFRVCFCSDSDNCGFTLTFRIKQNGSHVAKHKLVNGDFINGVILISTEGFPIAVDSLFCLEIFITEGTYQVKVNGEHLLEYISNVNMETNHLLQVLSVNNFTLFEVSVTED